MRKHDEDPTGSDSPTHGDALALLTSGVLRIEIAGIVVGFVRLDAQATTTGVPNNLRYEFCCPP